MEEFSFLRMTLPEDARMIMGDHLYSATMLLGFHANEVQTFQLLLAANLVEHPADAAFNSRAKITTNVLLRALCDRFYIATHFISSLDKEMRRCVLSESILASFDHEIIPRLAHYQALKDTEEYKLLRLIRDKINQHPTTQESAKRLKRKHRDTNEHFYFHDTKANSFFPASDDHIFGAALHNHFGGANKDPANQKSWEEWLSWLIENSGDLISFFHHFCVWLVRDLNIGSLDTVSATLERDRIGSHADASLPLFLRKTL